MDIHETRRRFIASLAGVGLGSTLVPGIVWARMRPHIYRTRDSGATWTEIVSGLAASGPVNVVREDPRQAGLLYAGTERQVFFSIDDGDRWNSLRQNMDTSTAGEDRSGARPRCNRFH